MPRTSQQRHTIEVCFLEKDWQGARIAEESESSAQREDQENGNSTSAERKKGSYWRRKACTLHSAQWPMKRRWCVHRMANSKLISLSDRFQIKLAFLALPSSESIVKAKRMHAFELMIISPMLPEVRKKYYQSKTPLPEDHDHVAWSPPPRLHGWEILLRRSSSKEA